MHTDIEATPEAIPSLPGKPSVLIVDDCDLFTDVLANALRDLDIRVDIAKRWRVEEILEQVLYLPAGVAVLDLSPSADPEGPQLAAVDLVAGLCRRHWAVLLLGGALDEPHVAAAVAAGAAGYLPKAACSFATLLHAIAAAAAGDPVLSEGERARWLRRHRLDQAERHRITRLLGTLTGLERSVLDLLADGNRAKAAADKLVVPTDTVRVQIRRILTKLAVGSQLEAVALAHRARRWGPHHRQPSPGGREPAW